MRVKAQVIARELVNDIIMNPSKYLLRYRCIVKLTSTFLRHCINQHGDASYALLLRILVRTLERNGFRLIAIYRSRSRKVYYFKPPESVCKQLSRAKVSESVSEALATSD